MEREAYRKKKEYLVCVDSDGCVMDTMEIKHTRCFGPCMVTEWNLTEWKDEILAKWNERNLYSVTRGMNRFQGLVMALREVDALYTKIPGVGILEKWVSESPELSNEALQKAVKEKDAEIFRKALSWSLDVNRRIDGLPFQEKLPFPGAMEGLECAHLSADLAVVSSANPEAVEEEWKIHGLLQHVDFVMSQNFGSKAFCIGELLKKGYAKEKVLMVGDAPGDVEAARKNGVCFFPVLVRKEKESWMEFREIAMPGLMQGLFQGSYQEEKLRQFWDNLK